MHKEKIVLQQSKREREKNILKQKVESVLGFNLSIQ